MSDQNNVAAEAAQILVHRRLLGQPGPRLPESCRPQTIDAALAIQAQVSNQIGDSIGGWKCGMPSDSRVVVAPIYTRGIHRESPVRLFARAGYARAEPELAFVFGQDLSARAEPYSEAEIDAAIGSAHLALELIQSRYDDPSSVKFVEALADGLVNQGLVLGPQIDFGRSRAASEIPLQISHSCGESKALPGRHPAAHPLAPLYWLVDFLRHSGQSICAGQVVITGSYAGVLDLPVDAAIDIRFGELGKLSVTFVAKP